MPGTYLQLLAMFSEELGMFSVLNPGITHTTTKVYPPCKFKMENHMTSYTLGLEGIQKLGVCRLELLWGVSEGVMSVGEGR